jgi:glycine cleavage system H protein
LDAAPESVNSDPYGSGWMIKIQLSNASEVDELMSSADYKGLVNA